MEALAFCEIREEEDSRGQRVAGMVQPLRPALAESTAALAEMTARLGGGAGAAGAGAAAARVAEFVEAAVGDVAPPAAVAPPTPPPASHAEVMARLDALAAQEEAAGARARRARATVGGAGWRGGFLGAKGKGRPGPAAPNPALDSTPAAAALMRRGPRARGGLGAAAAPAAAAPAAAAAPPPAPESRDAWRRGFLDRQDAPAARVVASASKPTIGAAARPANASAAAPPANANPCVRRVVERPAAATRSRPPVFDGRPPGAPLPRRPRAPAAGESLFARERAGN